MNNDNINEPGWKTGMRVPVDGVYEDQYGTRTFHAAHRTFPPCVDRKGEAAYRGLVSVVNEAA